jgi:hypothetical protein
MGGIIKKGTKKNVSNSASCSVAHHQRFSLSRRGEARRMKFLCDNERGGGGRRSENFLILVCTLAKEAFLGARAGKWRHTRGRIKAAEL